MNIRAIISYTGFCFTAASLTVFPVVATAQVQTSQVLEEIIVTAQKREQTLQDVPISVNVVSGSKLQEAGLERLEDIQHYVPNFTLSETGVGNNIYIRGIGSGINPGFEQSAAMFVDGVHYGRGQLYRAPVFDMERVEILRGSQSTLFGKNSIAGAISLTTRQPTDELEGELSFTAAQQGERESTVAISGPLTDGLSARLAIRHSDFDGYMRNVTLDRREPSREEFTGRLTLLWEASENLDFRLKYEQNNFRITGRQMEIISDSAFAGQIGYFPVLVGGFGQNPEILETEQNFRRTSGGDFSDNDSQNLTLRTTYFWDSLELTSITSWLQYDFSELCDCDFSSANGFDVFLDEDYEQFSQEFRLTSPLGRQLEWLAGVHYQTSSLNTLDRISVPANSFLGPAATALMLDFGAPLPTAVALGQALLDTGGTRTLVQDNDSWAGFGQLVWNFTDDTRLSLSARYSREKKEATRILTLTDADGAAYSGPDPGNALAAYALFEVQLIGHEISGSRTDHSVDWGINLQHDLTPATMIYTSATTGFKAGGFDGRSNALPVVPADANPFGTIGAGAFEFEDENAMTYEIGSKMSLLGGTAELNLALFNTRFEDLQVSIFDGVLGFNVSNAARARVWGVELDGRWAVTDRLFLSGAIGTLDFKFKDYDNGECYVGQTPDSVVGGQGFCSYDGQTNQYVADWSGMLSADYFFNLSDRLRLQSTLDLAFSDEFFTSQKNDPATVQDAYIRVNGRIALSNRADTWEIALIGRNLTDRTVVPYTNNTPLSFTIAGANSHYGFVERPRSIGLQGVWRF